MVEGDLEKMPAAHRENDKRSDSTQSKTIVKGQNSVYVNDKLWAVEDDEETDGFGHLISRSPGTIYIGDKKIIVEKIDDAKPDGRCGQQGADPEHCHPHPTEGSPNVFCYD